MLHIILFILTPVLLFSQTPFVLFTVPKSGTHLAKKLLEELSGKKGEFLYMPGYNFDQACREAFDRGTFYFYHYRDWAIIKDQESLFKKKKLFVNVRDPRDVCVSSAFFFNKELKALLGNEATFEEKLAYVITTTKIHDGLHDFFGPQALYERAFHIIDTFYPMVIHFEELVGPKGGGSKETQIQLIQEVGKRIGTFLTAEQAAEVGERIYGDSLTFREGHIGSWKNHFNEKITKLFKESYLNEALVRLGYEETLDW